MNRTFNAMRWLVAMLIVMGLFGVMPIGAAVQGDPTEAPEVEESETEEPDEPEIEETEIPEIEETEAPEPTGVPETEEPEIAETEIPETEEPDTSETEVPETEVPDATEMPQLEPDASPEVSLGASALLATDGTVVVSVRNASNVLLPGACFTVYRPEGGSLGPAVNGQCDGREDGNADGRVTFVLPPGDYVLVETFAPQGYVSGVRTSFTLGDGAQLPLTIVNQPGGRDVLILKRDESGNAIGRACFAIYQDNGGGAVGLIVSQTCDGPEEDPGDGTNYFAGIAPGNYVAVETRVPTGYVSTGNKTFTVPGTGTAPVNVTVVNRLAASPGNLVVNSVDENGNPLPEVCFDVFLNIGGGVPGEYLGGQCDFEDGQVVFTGLGVGNYVLITNYVPPGYIVGGSRAFSISASQATVLTIANVRGGATVTVNLVDGSGAPLPDSCFGIFRTFQGGGGAFVTGMCDDNGPGTNNGTMIMGGLPAGNYVLFESFTPDGYVTADDIPFTVDATGTNLAFTVENVTEATQVQLIIQALIRALIAAITAAGG